MAAEETLLNVTDFEVKLLNSAVVFYISPGERQRLMGTTPSPAPRADRFSPLVPRAFIKLYPLGCKFLSLGCFLLA